MSELVPKRLFVDMDGTLAVFRPVEQLETLYEENYFRDLPPHQKVVAAVKTIINEHPEIEVYSLSAVLSDSKYAIPEKNAWLDQHLPELDPEHRIFCPCGTDKKDYIPGGIRPDDHLLDDYTNNLVLWEPPAKGIKLLNGINHTVGTWKSSRLSYQSSSEVLKDNILSVISGETIIDQTPHQYTWPDLYKELTTVNESGWKNITIAEKRHPENYISIDADRFITLGELSINTKIAHHNHVHSVGGYKIDMSNDKTKNNKAFNAWIEERISDLHEPLTFYTETSLFAHRSALLKAGFSPDYQYPSKLEYIKRFDFSITDPPVTIPIKTKESSIIIKPIKANAFLQNDRFQHEWNAVEAQWKKILTSKDFLGAEWKTSANGNTYILTQSIRADEELAYQLSCIDSNGNPWSHHIYKKTDLDRLIQDLPHSTKAHTTEVKLLEQMRSNPIDKKNMVERMANKKSQIKSNSNTIQR